MGDDSFLSKYFLNTLETIISQVTTNTSWTDRILQAIVLIIAIFWIYAGLKIFFDSKERYRLGFFGRLLVLIVGIITGPIGLLIYIFTRPKFTLDEMDFIKTEHKFYYQNSSKVIECINCSAYLLDGYMFCTECGEQNRLRCENCNVLTNLDDKFCFYCGNKFEEREGILLNNKLAANKPELIENSEDTSKQKPLLIRKAYSGINLIKNNATNLFDFSTSVKNSFRGLVTTSILNIHSLQYKNKTSLDTLSEEGINSIETHVDNETPIIDHSDIVTKDEIAETVEVKVEKNNKKKKHSYKKKNKKRSK